MNAKKPQSSSDQKLSQLLRLKRQEKPDAAFWSQFDEELRSKQLAALVRTQSWYERAGKLSILIARKSAAATAAASVFVLGVFALTQTEFFTPRGIESSQAALAAATDAIEQMQANEEPIFIVADQETHPTELDHSPIPAIDAQPSYVVNTLTKQTAPVSYQINSSPKQFRAGVEPSENSLGAKVIRTSDPF